MAERDDAGIAEDQIERDRKQAPDGGLGQDQVPARHKPDGRESRDPECDLQRSKARATAQEAAYGGFEAGIHRGPSLMAAPCLRAARMTLRSYRNWVPSHHLRGSASGGRDAAQRLHRIAMKPHHAHRFAIAPMMDRRDMNFISIR